MPIGITLTPSSIAFGSVAVGSFSSMGLDISAMGFGPFSVTSVANANPDFSSNIATGPLSTGDNNFTVNYAPSAAGSESDTFQIFILDASTTLTTEYDLPVSGTGTAAPPAPVSGFVTVVSND
jgi:hypothetical protein